MHLQLFDTMSLCTEAEVQRMLPLVSMQRREQALRFRHLFGRFACLKAYELLKQCVAEVISDLSEESLFRLHLQQWNGYFVYNEHDKPMMQDIRSGKAIEGVDFSISHCQRAIVVALDSQPIGVDVECFRDASDSLLRKTMNVSEISQIKNAANPSIEFTRFWTQKEALLKMLGTGIVDELPDVLDRMGQFPSYQMQTVVNEKREYVYSWFRKEMKSSC